MASSALMTTKMLVSIGLSFALCSACSKSQDQPTGGSAGGAAAKGQAQGAQQAQGSQTGKGTTVVGPNGTVQVGPNGTKVAGPNGTVTVAPGKISVPGAGK